MGMTEAFLAAISPKGAAVTPVASIYLPAGAGGTLHVASEPFMHYRQDIVEAGFGTPSSSITTRRDSPLGSQRMTLTLADRGRYWSTLLSGRYNPRNSRVLCRMAQPELDEEDWFTAFDGVLDKWDKSADAVTLHCKTDETALKSYVPSVQLLAGAFPGADETEHGKYLPVVLGIHSAEGLTSQGMLPTVCISRNATHGYKYAVSLGACADVPRVYKNGSLQTVSTHYTVDQETWGGSTLTVISMVSSTSASDVVTCDAEGLTVDGTTGGSVILDPLDQLKWVCNNLIWNDWRGGSYYTDAPLDAAAFAKASAYAATFDPEGSHYFGGTTKKTLARDVVKRWIDSHPMIRLRWSFDGALAPVVIDHRFAGYSDEHWLDGDVDELRSTPFNYRPEAEGTVAKVSMQYLYGEADSKFWQSLEVQDLSRWKPESGEPERGEEGFELRYSSARFQ